MTQNESHPLRYHNHFRILPEHLSMETKCLDQDVTKFISDHIASGAPSNQIRTLVHAQFGINVTINQIRHKRQFYIDGMIGILDSNTSSSSAQMTAAEKLIKVFENMDDVSFVYVKHFIDSGFVTYTKDRSTTIQQTSLPHKDSQSLAAEIEIDTWRTSLGLSNNKEILVAFAWGHDYELRKLRMYPEWMAIDGTFGVNKQKRSLLTSTGYDGERKSFVGFRCFMPSKQKRAYSWAIGKALPFLVGDSIQFNQIITCDMEDALCNAIQENINDPSSPLHRSKLRIDFYHIFEQKWSERISANVYRIKGQKDTLDIIHEWISSWFDLTECTTQYQHSLSTFNHFVEHHKHVIGDHYLKEVEIIVGNIKRYIKECGYHHFMDRCTLGSKSSSVAEGSNFTLKSGPHAVKASMSLATSAHAQTQQVREKEHERNTDLSRRLTRYSMFSRSSTKDLVTDYMDLLLCQMHDTADKVTSFYVGQGKWYCISTNTLTSFVNKGIPLQKERKVPTYVNIRTVTLKDNYMQCSCGKVNHMMSPCIHIVSVIKKQTKVTPSMIPIRWWYTFMYYHQSEASVMAPNINSTCIDILKNFRKSSFNNDRSFKGIYIPNTEFDETLCQRPKDADVDWSAVQTIQRHIEMNGFLLKHSKTFDNLRSTRVITKINDMNHTTSIRFGGSAVSMSQMSQTHNEYDEEDSDSSVDDVQINNVISLEDTISFVTETYYACPNDNIRSSLYRMVADFKFKHCSQKADGSVLGAELSQNHKGIETRKRRRGDSSKYK